ncbi:hypothetical protein [Geomicrobium sp. JCM 19038]|uniref:hypothetical protein n=1 Tax=Geomicrobium sp. JCM 19038 TaxID=1460635 RepID=UPI00045F205D|nr:hypothetical protein [Geomicrobium sp. JCM 19038]GAK09608.1 hypothetical protein JCM19038_3450 [Geomicrobium sp. JCM 19038]
MSSYIVSRLHQLSESHLFLLAQDAQNRIGSHMITDQPDVHYIETQKAIVEAVGEEIERRKEVGTLQETRSYSSTN